MSRFGKSTISLGAVLLVLLNISGSSVFAYSQPEVDLNGPNVCTFEEESVF
jgi:hypothetical protein